MTEKMIGIVHNEPVSSGYAFSEASMDVLTQVEAIEAALSELGYPCVRIPFTRDVRSFVQAIRKEDVDMVINLCETVDEDPRFSGHVAALLELLGIPFSGSPALAIMLTTDKLISKRLLRASAIETPNYAVYGETGSFSPCGLRYPVIVKPRFEDASIGIDQDSIFGNEAELRESISDLSERFGTLLIEEYIEGREFNVSLMGYPSADVLPLAEIDFSLFPEALYPIVGYRAKWDKASFEYHHTPRRFPRNISPFLHDNIKRTAVDCFHLFMLRDYGRIDMRVDSREKIYVLEVNANPCLSPNAGFAAAAEEAGMSYSRVVGLLVSFMAQRSVEDGH